MRPGSTSRRYRQETEEFIMQSAPAFPYFVIAIALAVLLSGCAASPGTTPGTPTTPTPPQLQAANDVQALVDGLHAALVAVETAQKNGTISPGTLTTIETRFLQPALLTIQPINAAIVAGPDWPTSKAAILKILAAAGVQNVTANVPANAAAYITTALTLYNAVAAEIGGPTI